MHRRNSDKQVITGTHAELTSDTTIYPVNFELSPTDTADKGKHKLCDDIHTYAQLPFIEDGGGGGTTYTGTAPIVVTGTVISSDNSTGGNAATDAGKLVKFDATGKVTGSSATTIGVEGIASGTASAGVKGLGNGNIPGLYGQSINGPAVFGVSTGTGIGGQVVQSNLGNSANLFEYHNSDGEKAHIANDGSLIIADAPAKALTRVNLDGLRLNGTATPLVYDIRTGVIAGSDGGIVINLSAYSAVQLVSAQCVNVEGSLPGRVHDDSSLATYQIRFVDVDLAAIPAANDVVVVVLGTPV